MFYKFLNTFKSKKKKFQEKVKKEKSQIYLREKKKKNFYGNNKKRKKKQLSINVNIRKKEILSLSLIGFFLTLIGIVFLFKGTYFSITKIEIYSPDEISDINIAYKSVESLRGKNVFLTNKNHIQKLLTNYQKNIKSITLQKNIPDTFKIYIESFPIMFETLYNNRHYFITSNGIAIPKRNFQKENNETIQLNIIKRNKDLENFTEYKKIISEDLLSKTYLLIQYFKQNLVDTSIKEYNLYQTEQELHLKTQDNTLLIFDISENITEQIKKLAIFNKEKGDLKKIYFDLRVKNKIFYCDYDNEYQCGKNIEKLY